MANEDADVQGPVRVEYAVTEDYEHGPYPPPGDGWCAVRGANGSTLWRKIMLLQPIELPRGLDAATGHAGRIHGRSSTENGAEMKKHEVFPSKFLTADNLNSKPFVVTIERAPLETLKNSEGKEQAKTVLYFVGAKKALPLNMTNWDKCAEICGPDTDEWPGHRIELYPTKTQMGAKTVDCIRIRAPEKGELAEAELHTSQAAARG